MWPAISGHGPFWAWDGEGQGVALPGMLGGAGYRSSGGVFEGGPFGLPRLYGGGVEAQVAADAEADRADALATPLVDGLDARQLEHDDQVFRGEVAVRESA